MYKNDGAPVYCSECFNGDQWDPYTYAIDYSFSKNFFEQICELFNKVPRYYKYGFGNLINSEYTNYTKDNKNAYLSYSVTGCEDVAYSAIIDNSKNSIDCLAVMNVESSSYCVDVEKSYNVHHVIQSINCVDSFFLYDCANCTNCCLSSNLRNKQYYFKNQRMSKEDYFKAIESLHLNTYSGVEKAKDKFQEILKNAIHKYGSIYMAVNVTGDYIHDARNVKYGFDTNSAENISYGNRVIDVKDSMDITGVGFKAEMIYDSVAVSGTTFNDRFCYITTQGCRDCEYSLLLKNCSDCFGCVSLTNAKYCIFNKQFTKEEYFLMVEKIKKQMMEMPYVDAKGRVYMYGEFFPYELSPFGYNETNAHDFFPLSEETANERGYNWFKREKRDYKITKDSNDLPDSILYADDSILSETIACPNNGDATTQCTTAFKLTPEELQFYRQKNLPLPRFCPNCRHYERLKYRNPMRLYQRSCMCAQEGHDHSGKCSNEFETSYAPDRPEKVYCESCYQKEVL